MIQIPGTNINVPQDLLVRYGARAPKAVDFSNTDGNPLYVNSLTGDIYVMVGSTITQVLRTSAPTTVTAATYAVVATDTAIIANRAGTVTLTLPSASAFSGRELMIRTIQSQAVASDASNVVPLAGGAAGTAILSATAGKWARLKSDASNWQISESN